MKGILALGLALAFSCVWGGPLRAEESRPKGPSSTPRIELDRLFDIPATALPKARLRRGGRDREAWQEAFGRARSEVAELQARIEKTEGELHAFVQPDNQYSPLGGAARSDPKVLKLRQQLDRDRQSLETARRRLRDLDIEAALAGVPSDWRMPGPSSPPSGEAR